MRNFIPQQEHFDNFSDLINAASTKYTLSFKEACRALKCSRSWAQKYIRPNVPSIYVSNGKGTNKANYAKILSRAVNDINDKSGYSNESVYLDEAAFKEFILNSVVACQKRSKKVYKTYFIKPDYMESYYKELMALYSIFFSKKMSKVEADKLWLQIDTLYLNYSKNDYVKEIIQPSIVHQTKRTEAVFEAVSLPDVPISEWKAVHDLMDYGDIEETIYRSLFKEGCIRVELKIPDSKNRAKFAEKVYYIEDPEPVAQKIPDEKMKKNILKNCSENDVEEAERRLDSLIVSDQINIQQSAWVRYNNMLGNTITY